MTAPRQVLFLSFAVVLGCGDAPGDRQSVGTAAMAVERVENTGDDSASTWRLTPVWTVGGSDTGALSFTAVSPGLVGATRDGHVYVLDRAANRVVVLDSSGRPVRTLSRKGRGPGEFEFPSEMSVSSDGSVAVIDLAKLGAVSFAPNGDVLPIRTIPRIPIPNGSMRFAGDSVIYDFRTMDGDQQNGEWRLGIIIMRPADTTVVADAPFPVREPRVVNYGCFADAGQWPLFVPRFRWAFSGGRLAYTEGGAYQVTVLEPKAQRTITRAVSPIASEPRMVARAFPNGQTINTANGPCLVAPDKLREQLGMEPTLPHIAAIAVDPSGTLWVERWRLPDEAPRTDLFDVGGNYLGTLRQWGAPVAFVDASRALFAVVDEATDARRLQLVHITR